MKYFLFFCLFLYTVQTSFASGIYSVKTGYPAYKENVNNICKYYYKGKSELVYLIDETSSFTDLSGETLLTKEALEKARGEYENLMNEIFACANAASTGRALELISDKLIAGNPKLNSRLKSEIEKKQAALKKTVSELSGTCKITGESSATSVKKSVLDQTSYELCRYTFYLDYLYERNEKISANIKDAEPNTGISAVLSEMQDNKTAIRNEQAQIYRLYPIVYKAYIDYENNIGAHIVLELLREDYIVLRQQLHYTLNPLSLLGYKLKNAMKK